MGLEDQAASQAHTPETQSPFREQSAEVRQHALILCSRYNGGLACVDCVAWSAWAARLACVVLVGPGDGVARPAEKKDSRFLEIVLASQNTRPVKPWLMRLRLLLLGRSAPRLRP